MNYRLVDGAGRGNYYTIVCNECGIIEAGVYDKELEPLTRVERKKYLDSKMAHHRCKEEAQNKC